MAKSQVHFPRNGDRRWSKGLFSGTWAGKCHVQGSMAASMSGLFAAAENGFVKVYDFVREFKVWI